MIDVLDGVEEWLEEGKKVALVTLIATERSAPRDPGAALAVNEEAFVHDRANSSAPRPPNMDRIVALNKGAFVGAQPPLGTVSSADGASVARPVGGPS